MLETNKIVVNKDVVKNLLGSLFHGGTRPAIIKVEDKKYANQFAGLNDVISITADFLEKISKIWTEKFPNNKFEIIDCLESPKTTSEISSVNQKVQPAVNENKIIINARGQSEMTHDFKEIPLVSGMNTKSETIPNETVFPNNDDTSSLDDLKDNIQSTSQPVPLLNVSLDHEQDSRTTTIDVTNPDSVAQIVKQLPAKKNISPPLISGLSQGAVPPANTKNVSLVQPSVSFMIPLNARMGETFKCKILGKKSNNQELEIIHVTIPEGLGLTFNCVTQELEGEPQLAGEHKLQLQWRELGASSRQSDQCLLVVIPDAKSLWKNIEPPKDDHYFKSNFASNLLVTKDFKIAGASSRGRSHAHVGSFRDDDFYLSHDQKSGWSVIIVADGAGSAKNSRWGSKLAVEAAGNHLALNLAGDMGDSLNTALKNWYSDTNSARQEIGTKFHYLFHDASIAAIKSIEEEALSKNAPPKEYSTTLLAAAIRRTETEIFLSTFWMGDGAIAVYGPYGKVRLMGTPDSGEYAGQTRFLDRSALSDKSFSKRIGMGLFSDISAILLMTDGISDPRFETDNGLKDPQKWDALWNEISPCLLGDTPEKNLISWLDFLTPGHHDDRTIALLWY